MPEGHSVHRIANRFTAVFAEAQVAVSSPQGRFSQGAELLDGREMTACRAVGKQMFAEFDGELTLRVHLGLYGAWDLWERAGALADGAADGASASSMGAPRRTGTESRTAARGTRAGESDTELRGAPEAWPPAPVGAVRARLLAGSVCADLRGPTVCEVLTPEETAARLLRLGPDPLVDGRAAGRRRFLTKASRKRTAVGAVLMDQEVIAGIGNIYRAELLFRARVNPYTPTASLGEETLAGLWDDWCRLLPLGVETGVILTRTELRGRRRERALAEPEHRHWVYGRQGQPCLVCGTPVSLAEMQGRKLYWCAQCQAA